MVTYDRLCKTPTAFPALTGVTREEFDRLFDDFTAAHHARRAAATHAKRGARRLARPAGAGHPFALDGRTRPAMGLVWLRVYPTYEVLGWRFDLDKSNARHNVRDVLATLQTLAAFPFERPAAGRRKPDAGRRKPDTGRRKPDTVGAVTDAFPQVRLVIDGKEQGVPPARGLGRPEAVLPRPAQAAHGQDAGRLPPGRAGRGGGRQRAGVHPRPDAAAAGQAAGPPGRGRGGDARQGVRGGARPTGPTCR